MTTRGSKDALLGRQCYCDQQNTAARPIDVTQSQMISKLLAEMSESLVGVRTGVVFPPSGPGGRVRPLASVVPIGTLPLGAGIFLASSGSGLNP